MRAVHPRRQGGRWPVWRVREPGWRGPKPPQAQASPRTPGQEARLQAAARRYRVVGRWTLEELDASEHAFPAVGTQTQATGQEFEEPLTVLSVLGVRPGDRLRLAESVPAAGEELGPGSVGQKAVVTDPDEALGEDVEEEAADRTPRAEASGIGAAEMR